ncbi:MAG: aspartyl/glutamyl-tRNA amidotransferase subunit C [Methanomethylovorans sp. PtaU1.Bin073]|nr:MAG: aspartyl/glutamyl-tRNA amidotransferase subunit C [Methanomethylovorans sp. PtaU1.Bin073]
MITKEEVEHVGWLARIEIHKSEAQAYAEKLNAVLDYFSQLDEVDTENVPPTYHVADIINVFREDVIKPSMPQEEVLSNTEKKQEGNFLAPRIM